jgi:DNA-binding XRE family transcriptional regulator
MTVLLNPRQIDGHMTVSKYVQVAAMVRSQVANGELRPGEPAPSGDALARATGYSPLTCRKALRTLVREGTLVSGTSRSARPRVPVPSPTPGEQTLADATRALSATFARLRRSAGLTQPELAALVGVSITTVGHAETGRLWHSRRFWELADKELAADGELLVLHDAFRAAATARRTGQDNETEPHTEVSTTVEVAASGPVACVAITWVDGSVTTVHPPSRTT